MPQGKHNRHLLLFIAFLTVLDGVVWSLIFFPRASADEFAIYFLDVGQGDGALITFPGGVQAVIDGGPPNGRLLAELGRILPLQDRYIDLVFLSHPQLDHFGGFIDILGTYEIGTFLGNGKAGETKSYEEFARIAEAGEIPQIALRAGDRIRYGDYAVEVLSPLPEQLGEKELNESALVLALSAPAVDGAEARRSFRALFTGDIGAKTERLLAGRTDLRAQVLKVPHHGSKYSSSAEFLAAVAPQVAAIGVGKNTYGHPTAEALGRLEAVGARVFRTDLDGTIKVIVDDGVLRVFTRRTPAAQRAIIKKE